MHIEAELDDIHSERLILLQQSLQKPLPEVLATVIDWAIASGKTTNTEVNSEAERLAALAYLNMVSIDWGGKPIENRDSEPYVNRPFQR